MMTETSFPLRDGKVELKSDGLAITDGVQTRKRINVAGVCVLIAFICFYVWFRLIVNKGTDFRLFMSWLLFAYLCYQAYGYVSKKVIGYSVENLIRYEDIQGIDIHHGAFERRPAVQLKLSNGKSRYLRLDKEHLEDFRNALPQKI